MKTSSLGLKMIFWPAKRDTCFQHYHIIFLFSDILRSQSSTIKEISPVVNSDEHWIFLTISGTHVPHPWLHSNYPIQKQEGHFSFLCSARSCACHSNQVVHKAARPKLFTQFFWIIPNTQSVERVQEIMICLSAILKHEQKAEYTTLLLKVVSP